MKQDVKILIDFCCFTIKHSDFVGLDFDGTGLCELIEQKLLLGDGRVEYVCKRGFNGYAVSFNSTGITYCYGYQDHIYIQMSGVGCRHFETLNPKTSWADYIKFLQDTYKSLHFSRLDVAGDSFNLLNIVKIQRYTLRNQFISKFRNKPNVNIGHEMFVIFGSTKSMVRLRIYDKTLERQAKLGLLEEIPENWVRVEFQFRDDAALSFINAWQQCQDIGLAYRGILHNQLQYFSSFDGHNYDRIGLAKWWSEFLQGAQKIKMAYQGGLEYNLENLKEYIFKQAGSSIRTYLELNGGDITELVNGVFERKLNEKQQDLIKRQQLLQQETKSVVQLHEEWQQRVLEKQLTDEQLELLNSWRGNDIIK